MHSGRFTSSVFRIKLTYRSDMQNVKAAALHYLSSRHWFHGATKLIGFASSARRTERLSYTIGTYE